MCMNRLITLLISLLIFSGCTVRNMAITEDVKPWQKDILAQRSMQFP